MFRITSVACLLLLASAAMAEDRVPLVEHVRPIISDEVVRQYAFNGDDDVWSPMHQAKTSIAGGVLKIESQGHDPYVRVPTRPVKGPVVFRWRMRADVGGSAEVFWGSVESPGTAADRSVRVAAAPDGKWANYEVVIAAEENINLLRFDPGPATGVYEVAEATLLKRTLHPLCFQSVQNVTGGLKVKVASSSDQPIRASLAGRPLEIAPRKSVEITVSVPHRAAFEPFELELAAEGFPVLRRTVYLHHADLPLEGPTLTSGSLRLQATNDGRGARLWWKDQLAAALYPLAECDGAPVKMACLLAGDTLQLRGGPVERMTLRLSEGEVRCRIQASEAVTGPAVRVIGPLEQGLLAGVEHLGKGEASSSKLDLETAEHIRYEPDPMLITMPLAAYVTAQASVALLWDDPWLRPVFATPNRYDDSADHLMTVKGRNMQLRLRVADGFAAGQRLEDAIAWALQVRGLPSVPPAPRTRPEQDALSLWSLEHSVRNEQGWMHIVQAKQAANFADHLSTIWRLTDKLPSTPNLAYGGSHVENAAAYCVSGRAAEWLKIIDRRAEGLRKQQQADGGFLYQGKYARKHFEDTASGICALPAAILLDHARYTGNAESLAAGLKALDYMQRFRTPRGAQTWEVPLHTPDILASAYLVRAYVRGYELTKKPEYLELARRWAFSGVPFVYQWRCRPVMRYATIAVLGATDWTGTVWIGLPVQWCGTVYAHSLLLLAPYDQTVEWRKLAEGITVCAEQMQYIEGPSKGCLPDSYHLANQVRNQTDINPCVLVALRRMLDGKLDALAVASDAAHRVVAPYPVKIEANQAVVEGVAGQRYEVVIDGQRVVPVTSTGTDRIPLAP